MISERIIFVSRGMTVFVDFTSTESSFLVAWQEANIELHVELRANGISVQKLDYKKLYNCAILLPREGQ